MLAVICGEAGTGKTTLWGFYGQKSLIFTPDAERLKRTFKKIGRTDHTVKQVDDLEQLCDLLVRKAVKSYPGPIVIEDFSILCNRFLDLIATQETEDGKIVRIKPQLDHFGSLSRFSKAAVNILSGRHALIFTHLGDLPEGQLGPEAGTKNGSGHLARTASDIIYLRTVEIEPSDPVRAYKTRCDCETEDIATKTTQMPSGIHPPYLPLLLPDYCPEKPPLLTKSLEKLGERLAETSGSERVALLRKAKAKGISKELISLVFQYQMWKDYEPEILL